MEEKALQNIGFSEKEAKVYLIILEKGRILPAQVAKITGINRSTVYAVVKELIKKRVVVEDLGDKQSYLIALPPTSLTNLLQEEEQKLLDQKRKIDDAIKDLASVARNTKYSIPKIHFVYEEDLESFLYRQAPEWSRSIMDRDNIWWGYQDPSYAEHYQKHIDWYWQKSAPKKLKLHLLSSESNIEEKMAERNYERRIIKFWKRSENFTATTWVCGDYLILLSTDKHPYYLVQIHDPILAHNMREMFKGIWTEI